VSAMRCPQMPDYPWIERTHLCDAPGTGCAWGWCAKPFVSLWRPHRQGISLDEASFRVCMNAKEGPSQKRLRAARYSTQHPHKEMRGLESEGRMHSVDGGLR
jgi:hypothetical protein